MVELAVCLPLLLLTILMMLTFIDASGRKIVTERIAAANSVTALNSAEAQAPADSVVSGSSNQVFLADAPEGLRDAVATIVTVKSGGGWLFIKERPFEIAPSASYIVLQP